MTRPRYWKKTYREYINSPAWRRKRRFVLERADGWCESCGDACDYLEVHHLHYRRFKKERLTDLLAVCKDCHEVLDAARRAENARQRFVKRVTAWMNKVDGRTWPRRVSWEQAVIRFNRWLTRKSLK